MRPDDLEAQQQYQNDLLSEFNGNSRPQSSTSAELEMGMSSLNIGNMVQSSLQQPSTSQTPPQLMPGGLGNISRSKVCFSKFKSGTLEVGRLKLNNKLQIVFYL